MKDLGVAYCAVMAYFRPWTTEAHAIVNLVQAGTISECEGMYRLYILLKPFMDAYPAGYSIQDLEADYLLQFNFGTNWNRDPEVKSDSRYMGINYGDETCANVTGGWKYRIASDKTRGGCTSFARVSTQIRYRDSNNRFKYRTIYTNVPDCPDNIHNYPMTSNDLRKLGDVLYYLFNMPEIMEQSRIEIVKKFGGKRTATRTQAAIDIHKLAPGQTGGAVWNDQHDPLYYLPPLLVDTLFDERVEKRCCSKTPAWRP